MHTAALVALILVATVGLPAAIKNWTSLALVWNYIIVTGIWWVTGEASLHLAIIADYIVIVVIFLKTNNSGEPPPGALGWAKDWWRGLSWWDKVVIGLFLPSWTTYAVMMPKDWEFWIAWTAGVAQLFVAGGEALEWWRRGQARAKTNIPTDTFIRRQGLVGNGCH